MLMLASIKRADRAADLYRKIFSFGDPPILSNGDQYAAGWRELKVIASRNKRFVPYDRHAGCTARSHRRLSARDMLENWARALRVTLYQPEVSQWPPPSNCFNFQVIDLTGLRWPRFLDEATAAARS